MFHQGRSISGLIGPRQCRTVSWLAISSTLPCSIRLPVLARSQGKSPETRISVPAGTFDTVRIIYQIEKSKGTERYEVLATKALPRMMIREDFPNGTSSELVGNE